MTETQTARVDEKIGEYANPDVVVSPEWVAQHLDDPSVRVVEADEDVLLYEVGHIPGSVKIDWHSELQDPIERDFVDQAGFEELMSSKGIGNDTTIVLYGDKNNWYATYTFWLLKMYGHPDVRVMDGGRLSWEQQGRPWTRDVPNHPRASYRASPRDESIRAFRDDVFKALESGTPLIDVRSPAEYKGELIHMLDYPQEGAQRGGHIPGAFNIPWGTAANASDGTFKTRSELESLYRDQAGIDGQGEVISYCRIGERSSHTWFVLTYLLGYPNIRNYDGSWTEWGNLVDAPIEK